MFFLRETFWSTGIKPSACAILFPKLTTCEGNESLGGVWESVYFFLQGLSCGNWVAYIFNGAKNWSHSWESNLILLQPRTWWNKNNILPKCRHIRQHTFFVCPSSNPAMLWWPATKQSQYTGQPKRPAQPLRFTMMSCDQVFYSEAFRN